MSALILASASPRRIEMLRNVRIDFNIVPSEVEESSVNARNPHECVKECARLKAFDVAKKYPDSWILGADTIVVINSEILGKPVDENHAVEMLRKLSGKRHRVISAFCLMKGDEGKSVIESVETEVLFKRLSDYEIRGYVATGEPMDKAGAYGIQGIGSFLVKEIKGSYTNVVGLPLAEVIDALTELGVARPFEANKTSEL